MFIFVLKILENDINVCMHTYHNRYKKIGQNQDQFLAGYFPHTIEITYNEKKLPTKRLDKLVSVMINGKWETRMFDDVSKTIMKTTEEYFNPFFVELQDKYYDIIQAKDGRKIMQLMAPIWRLATYITQHMGWNCKEIRKLGLNIDYDDDLDKEDLQRQIQRIKDVYTLILDKLHDKTLEIKDV